MKLKVKKTQESSASSSSKDELTKNIGLYVRELAALEEFESKMAGVLSSYGELKSRVESAQRALEEAATRLLPVDSVVVDQGVRVERYTSRSRSLDTEGLLKKYPSVIHMPGALKMNLDSFDKLMAAGSLPNSATSFLSEKTKEKVDVKKV